MSEASSKVAQAEARFRATQKRQEEGHAAREQYEAEGRAIREKTERLRALRLAKEAAEAAGEVPAKPRARRSK
ncbi:MAG: hypothetical protein WCA55_18595 [Xanthobacteraceae bacterium]